MQLAPPAVPPDVLPLWTAGTALVTTMITQLLKNLITPLHNAPDAVKAGFALAVAIVATVLGHLAGGPLPSDLPGAVGVLVSWLSSMGAHRLALVLGLVKPTTPA